MSLILRNARVRLSTSTEEEGAHDVSDAVTKVTVERQLEMVDLTTLPMTARNRIAGREEWLLDVGLLQCFSTDQGATGLRLDKLLDTLAGITAAGNTFRVAVLPKRDQPRSVTNPEYVGTCVLENYSPLDGEVGNLLKVTPSFVGCGDLSRDTTSEDDAIGHDTVSVTLSEGSGTVVCTVYTSDTINLNHTDNAIIGGATVPKAVTDTLAVQAGEVTVLTKTFPISGDTISVSMTDVATVRDTAISKSVTDVMSVIATDGIMAQVAHATSDTITVQLLEAGSVGIVQDVEFLQSASGTGSGTSKAVAFSLNVVAGSLLVAAISASNSISSITDTQGNTWQVAVGYNAHGIAVWYCENAAAGATTVTVNFSGSTSYNGVSIHEYAGVLTSGALDDTSEFSSFSPVSAGTDSFSTPSITPTYPKSLLFGFTQIEYPLATAPGTSFTQREEPFVNTMTEDRIEATVSAVSAVFSHSGGTSDDTCGILCVFKPQVTF